MSSKYLPVQSQAIETLELGVKYLMEINVHEIKFCVDLFSRMRLLTFFAWIYFRGSRNSNNLAWIYFVGCQICIHVLFFLFFVAKDSYVNRLIC